MSLIGKTVKLVMSDNYVVITKADNKGIYIDFGNNKPILVPYDKCEELLRLDDETRQEIIDESNKPHFSQSRNKSEKHRVEGTENIAFKVTYCDGGETNEKYGFRDACSENCRITNQSKGRSWCNEGRCPCMQLAQGLITKEEFDNIKNDSGFYCYESRMLTDWKAYAGTDNKKNPPRPRRFNQLRSTGIAVLTTVPNNKDDRFIFALFKIAKYFEGDETQEGYLEADPKFRIEFTKDESEQMRFWDFYSNKNSDKEQWGTGLFRYLSNEQVTEIFKKALEVKTGKEDYSLVKELFDVFLNEINIKK